MDRPFSRISKRYFFLFFYFGLKSWERGSKGEQRGSKEGAKGPQNWQKGEAKGKKNGIVSRMISTILQPSSAFCCGFEIWKMKSSICDGREHNIVSRGPPVFDDRNCVSVDSNAPSHVSENLCFRNFFLRIRLASKCIRRIFFENAI